MVALYVIHRLYHQIVGQLNLMGLIAVGHWHSSKVSRGPARRGRWDMGSIAAAVSEAHGGDLKALPQGGFMGL